MTNLSKTTHSTVKRPFHKNTTFKNSNFNQRVNIVKDKNVNTVRPKAVVNAAKPKAIVNAVRPKAVVNVVKGNNVNAVKASACWVWKPKNKVLDHVSKHNSASITLKKFNYVDAQGISNSTMKRLMDDMLPLEVTPKEGKSQEELTDESQVLLKVPRKNNMYSVDLKYIVPKGGLTCLFAKATSDESELWHRRLGHINFKTMNKLVKGNLKVNIVKDKNVNIAKSKAVVNAIKGNNVNAVKASACWVWKPKTKVLDHDQRVIDSGYSKHMTGNMSYLTDYEEIDG
ncbi:putative ribonuclease H-like domain-containing protein [Tanacetum coccineum]